MHGRYKSRGMGLCAIIISQKQEVQAETKQVDRRLGRPLPLWEKNGMERRMKKSMEGGKEGKQRDDAEGGDVTPSSSTPFLA